LEVVALGPDPRQAQHRELPGREPPLELFELVRLDRAVGDVRLDVVAVGEGVGELAQAPDAFGEHDHLLLARDAGDRLRGDPAQQREAVAAAAHRLSDKALADQRLGERRLGVRQRLGVNRGVHIDPHIAENDALGSGELGERLFKQLAAGLQSLELAQHLQQPAVGFAAAVADRVQQRLEGGVGVDRQRLRGPDVGHPGVHVLAGDADEVRAVVDAQPVRADLVHQIPRLQGAHARTSLH